MFLTDTHLKYAFDLIKEQKRIESRRAVVREKGGGLMASSRIEYAIEKQQTKHPNWIWLKMNKNLNIVLVYLKFDYKKNSDLIREMHRTLEKIGDDESSILLGDFNGHEYILESKNLTKMAKR